LYLVELFAQCVHTVNQCNDEIELHGLLVDSDYGLKTNPAVTIRNQTMTRLHALSKSLALSHKDRESITKGRYTGKPEQAPEKKNSFSSL